MNELADRMVVQFRLRANLVREFLIGESIRTTESVCDQGFREPASKLVTVFRNRVSQFEKV